MATLARTLPPLAAAAAAGGSTVTEWIFGIGGLLLVFAWIGWRFGPAIARYCGWAFWWIGWACGIEGGYAYAIFFLILGTASWATGTIWYAARRGYWPSLLSQRLFTRVLRLHDAAAARTSQAAPMLENLPTPPARAQAAASGNDRAVAGVDRSTAYRSRRRAATAARSLDRPAARARRPTRASHRTARIQIRRSAVPTPGRSRRLPPR